MIFSCVNNYQPERAGIMVIISIPFLAILNRISNNIPGTYSAGEHALNIDTLFSHHTIYFVDIKDIRTDIIKYGHYYECSLDIETKNKRYHFKMNVENDLSDCFKNPETYSNIVKSIAFVKIGDFVKSKIKAAKNQNTN